jgi:uncharacterized protein (TIGR02001 family)
MKLTKLSALCLAASSMFATSSAVMAEESAWEVSGNVALSSEYVWRGVGQSASDPAISGGFDLGHESGFYIGTWASNVDFGASDASIEIDYYGGFGGEIGDSGVSYDVGVLYYDYPSASDEDLDFTELYGFVGYGIFSAGVSYTIDADDDTLDDSMYYQLDAGYDVGMVSLAAGIGYYDYDDDNNWDDYVNWYLGASTDYAGVTFDITYHDVDESDSDSDTVVFTISKSL